MTRASYSGDSVGFNAKYADLTDKIKTRYDSLGVTYRATDHAGTIFYKQAFVTNENQQYFYHSDHLGSSSLITNLGGDIVQHIEYVSFDEVFIEESKSTWNTPCKFNAKALREKFGADIYDRIEHKADSLWRVSSDHELSADGVFHIRGEFDENDYDRTYNLVLDRLKNLDITILNN